MSLKPLHVLIIEDNPSDAGLIERHLRQAGFDLHALRVDTQADLAAALHSNAWQIVLSDYHLPAFSAVEALALVRQHTLDLPFIVVSGMMGEDKVVEVMCAGAQDYVMKDQLARLAPAVERELVQAARRREHRQLSAQIDRHEARLQLALSALGDGVWEWNPQTGEAVLSPAWKHLLGYEPDELANDMAEWRSRIHPDDAVEVARANAAQHSDAVSIYQSEHRLRCKDGSWKWVHDRGVILERDAEGRPLRELGTTSDITNAKHAETALRERNEILHKLAQQAPGMLYQFQQHPDGHFSMPYVSHAVTRMFEVDAASASSDAAALFAQIHPEDVQTVLASIDVSARQLSRWSQVFRVVLPAAGLRWHHGESQPERLADGSVLWHGFMHDITEQRAAEAEVNLLRACVDHVNDSLLVTEAEPVSAPGPLIVYANPVFYRETGFLPEEVLGQSPRILQGPNSNRDTLDRIAHALHHWEPVRVEILNYRKSGETFWSELDISPVADSNGWYTHWVSLQRDITARKHAEAQREHLLQTLNTRNEELDAYNFSVAHDLRNPVISIRGMTDVAEIALDRGDIDKARACLTRVAKSANQADTLIRKLMEVAKHGSRALTFAALPARATVGRIVASIDLLTDSDPETVSIEIDEQLEIWADEALLGVIITNLVSNAIRYRHPERAPKVRLLAQASTAPNGVMLKVYDNGIGIESVAHTRVFRLFERVSAGSEGTGVGLALVDRAARQMGGRAELAESTPGVGSCFSVWLPAAPS